MAQASEEMQPVDAVQSVEVPETVAYNTESQITTPESKTDAYNTALLDTAQENEAVAYNAELQDTVQENEVVAYSAESQTMEQVEAIPSEHEVKTAGGAETLFAVASATRDAATASVETEIATRDEASVEQS